MKFALALGALLAFAPMQDPVYTLKITPNPLSKGRTAAVEYDGPDGTEITLDFGDYQTTAIVRNGKAVFTVPQNATGLIASDPWGNTDAASVSP